MTFYQPWGPQHYFALPTDLVELVEADKNHSRTPSLLNRVDKRQLQRAQKVEQARRSCWDGMERKAAQSWSEALSRLERSLQAPPSESEGQWEEILEATMAFSWWELQWEHLCRGSVARLLRSSAQDWRRAPLPPRPVPQLEELGWALECLKADYEADRYDHLYSERLNLQDDFHVLFHEGWSYGTLQEVGASWQQLELACQSWQEMAQLLGLPGVGSVPWIGTSLAWAVEKQDKPLVEKLLGQFRQEWTRCCPGLLMPVERRTSLVAAIDGLLDESIPEAQSLVELAQFCQEIAAGCFEPRDLYAGPFASYLELFSRLLAGTRTRVELEDLLLDHPAPPEVEECCRQYLLIPRPEPLLQAAQLLTQDRPLGPYYHCPFCDRFYELGCWRCACGMHHRRH